MVDRLPIGAVIRKILPQIVILTVIGVLYLLSHVALIPSPMELNRLLVESFKHYGLPLIAVCAFLENLIGINAYFPGAFTILTGMALTAGNPTQAIVTYFVIYLPSYAANVVSFYIGFLNKTDSTNRPPPKKRNQMLWFLLTYWHPQLAAVTAYSAGATRAATPKLFIQYSLQSSFFWSVFWAVIIYRFGIFADVGKSFVALFLGYVLIWAAFDIYRCLRRRPLVLPQN